MIEAYKWNGHEPLASNGAPQWIVRAYECGQIITICDRKTGVKELIARTKYGNMTGLIGCYVLRFQWNNLMILDEEDRKLLLGENELQSG